MATPQVIGMHSYLGDMEIAILAFETGGETQASLRLAREALGRAIAAVCELGVPSKKGTWGAPMVWWITKACLARPAPTIPAPRCRKNCPARKPYASMKCPRQIVVCGAIRQLVTFTMHSSCWPMARTRNAPCEHLVDSTDFWNLRTTRLAAIFAYLQEMTAQLPHWAVYKDALAQLAIGVEHHRG